MPETRRELFKASVITAIGGLAAGALAGCATGLTSRDVPAGSVIVIRGSSNGASYLYFFHFEQLNSNCRVYTLPATPTAVSTSGFDTVTVFEVAFPALTQVVANTAITYVGSDGANATFQVCLDGSLYLSSDATCNSLGSLLALLSTPNYSSAMASGSWNEIGKNRN